MFFLSIINKTKNIYEDCNCRNRLCRFGYRHLFCRNGCERDLAGNASAIIGLTQNLLGGLISPLVGLGGLSTYAPMSWIILICEISALICWFIGNHALTQIKQNQ